MSNKGIEVVGAAARAPQPSDAGARERAENEGMPARLSVPLVITTPPSELEGEGSRTAAHHYEEGVKRSIEQGTTEALAEEARLALDGPEAATLRQAEQAARLGQHAKITEA